VAFSAGFIMPGAASKEWITGFLGPLSLTARLNNTSIISPANRTANSNLRTTLGTSPKEDIDVISEALFLTVYKTFIFAIHLLHLDALEFSEVRRQLTLKMA
jgi:hypothetical protein